jgi:hypothetical protein
MYVKKGRRGNRLREYAEGFLRDRETRSLPQARGSWLVIDTDTAIRVFETFTVMASVVPEQVGSKDGLLGGVGSLLKLARQLPNHRGRFDCEEDIL